MAVSLLVSKVVVVVAEIRDKAQVATMVLAAQYHALILLLLWTTLGTMVANVPVVPVGDAPKHCIPLGKVCGVTALLFAALADWYSSDFRLDE